jgi:hypothetical protein
MPVRLFIVTDWDAGFQLTAHPPLPDVAPGETYVTECKPQRPVAIYEALVDGFSIVTISAGSTAAQPTLKTGCVGEETLHRVYQFNPALIVGVDDWLRIQLCNDSSVPRKQKLIALVKAP